MGTIDTAGADDDVRRLLADLEAAVRAGDRTLAHEIGSRIEAALMRRIEAARADAAAWADASLRRVAELLGEVDRTADRGPSRRMMAGAEAAGGAAAATGATVFPVWFGTNRTPAGDGFGGMRSKQTTFGVAMVSVPEAHRFGEVGSSWWTKLVRLDVRDDTLGVQRINRLTAAAFAADVAAAVQAGKTADGPPRALVFIHGFNVSFAEAAVRAAQLGVDLGVPGATAFFSWPSRGSLTAYAADEATIEASEAAIADFLAEFGRASGAEQVDVVAHSMGNRGLLRALQRIAADATRRTRVRFGQIILAAPDVDRDLFLDLAHLYPEHCDRCTLYASNRDTAVHASAWVHWGARAGYFEPYTVTAGVDTIAVPDFNVDLLGHGYFATADRLLHDIWNLLHHPAPPERRQGLLPMHLADGAAWRFRR
jgi:esterase/lipase superfamily enzyme